MHLRQIIAHHIRTLQNLKNGNDPNKDVKHIDSLFNREAIGQLIGSTKQFEEIKNKKLDELIRATTDQTESVAAALKENAAATQGLVDSIQSAQSNNFTYDFAGI